MKFIVREVDRSHRTSRWSGGDVKSTLVKVYLESEDGKCSMDLAGPSLTLAVGDEIVIGFPSFDQHVITDLTEGGWGG